MEKDLLIEMENVLRICLDRGYHSMTKCTDELTRKAIRNAEARGWIIKSNSSYKLTPIGMDLLDSGTVEEFLLNKKSKKDSIPISQTVINTQNLVSDSIVYGDISQSSDNSVSHSVKINENKAKSSLFEKISRGTIVSLIVSIIIYFITKLFS